MEFTVTAHYIGVLTHSDLTLFKTIMNDKEQKLLILYHVHKFFNHRMQVALYGLATEVGEGNYQ